MKIGIAGPISLELLADILPQGQIPSNVYSFPLIAELARELVAQGHSVSVFATATGLVNPLCIKGQGITVHILPRRCGRRPLLDLFRDERRYMSQAMRQSDCDIIHAHWTYEFALAAIDSGKPTLITAHDAPLRVLWLIHRWDRLFYFLISLRVLWKSRHMAAVSPYIENHLRRVLRYRGQQVVIPNGLTSEVVDLGRKRLQASPRPVRTFATVLSFWQTLKNPKPVIEAFQLVRRQLPEARLIMFGTGFEPGAIAEQWARERGMAEGIEFIGRLPHAEMIARLDARAHALIHPSLEESFSMACAEAMALGLPVIAGNASGAVPWTVGDGGLLVDVRDSRAIATAMLRLATDLPLACSLACAGLQRVEDTFTVERVCRHYVRQYEHILHDDNLTSP